VLIDDDADFVQQVGETLVQQGYEVYTAYECEEGLLHIANHRPDLVIMDVVLANSNGRETCQRIREMSDVPMMVLAAQGRDEEIARGLAHGADDYLTKPFGIEQLVTRMQVLLRRARVSRSEEPPAAYRDEYLAVDLADRRVEVHGDLVKLTPTEYRLLACLVQNAGRVLTYEKLLEDVWGQEYVNCVDYVRIYMWRLRKKIEKDSRQPEYILTEYGIGYRFEKAR
jgi:two-component system KDP operon response regulator KdpE